MVKRKSHFSNTFITHNFPFANALSLEKHLTSLDKHNGLEEANRKEGW